MSDHSAGHENAPSLRFVTDAPVASIETGLIRAHAFAALASLMIAALLGTIVAVKLVQPEFLGGHVQTTWGSMRANHTQGIFFGWFGNAFLAFFYFAVPRLGGRAVMSRRLGWILFGLWNVGVVLLGWVLVSLNPANYFLAIKPLEWTEFPLIVNAVTEICLVLMALQFIPPLARQPNRDGMYVSSWYILGGLIFTLLAFPVGSLVPEWAPGAVGAAFSGLWIHDAVGLYITPLALAMAFYIFPVRTGRPIYSHFLSMLGFWLLFFSYPLNGTHHYVYSSIPMDTQRAAIAASVIMGFDVMLVVFNLLMSLRGQATLVARDVPLRFVWTGVVIYLIVSLQGSLQALMPMQRYLHFSDWVIGHSHLAMLGFGAFIVLGGIAHVWQRSPHFHYHHGYMNWAYWLILSGLAIMFIDLTAAGLMQGKLWISDAPWMDSVRASKNFWLIRAFAAAPILVGFAAFIAGLLINADNRSANNPRLSNSAMQPVPAHG
ncbi:MAG: cbb3-type cytochrome c oxidase subunit I [Gammaproteobacteria bacterium]|nr:cbb3-type cytochrome c oxidase subunit I [Gammaproteobacteria bacterium]